MTANLHRESAKIFIFPTRERTVSERGAARQAAELLAAEQNPQAGYGDSWYHEAAILEAGRTLKS